MITVPLMSGFPVAKVYGDSAEAGVAYVDMLEPAAMHGTQVARWFPMPGQSAYLAGEVGFGPGAQGFGGIAESLPDKRLLPMPWKISTVYVSYREGEGSKVVAEGKTSGYGASNAVFNGNAPLAALAAPVRVAAELECEAQTTVRVRGGGDRNAVSIALAKRISGEGWDATVGEVLLTRFRALLERRALTLTINGDALTGEASEDVMDQALLEWAHAVELHPQKSVTLAYPITALSDVRWSLNKDLALDWEPGDTIALRALRVLRCAKLG
jgi:hypothetical protein